MFKTKRKYRKMEMKMKTHYRVLHIYFYLSPYKTSHKPGGHQPQITTVRSFTMTRWKTGFNSNYFLTLYTPFALFDKLDRLLETS